jgi:alkanesulfonate monooxygenase SsuD/methylene tetrahydromethanopterin reductase-like flavin-dependent oxidoreductase (luciferase family)
VTTGAKVAVADDRSAALLLRVWMEEGSDQFRARLMAVGTDGQAGDRTVSLASTPDDVIDAVRRWLDDFITYRTAFD